MQEAGKQNKLMDDQFQQDMTGLDDYFDVDAGFGAGNSDPYEDIKVVSCKINGAEYSIKLTAMQKNVVSTQYI